ncbi:MAG TPA: hypothetical protein PK711_04985 [Bacteroidales bacterium]|nr:hypothetical protein [Bacteroidales bacterium]
MKNNDLPTFRMLKQKVAERMLQSYPGINPVISEWKGQEIVDFQEELLKNVNAHISEKWFYTHMKSSHPKLPRIDMLNLLSRYAGYANWDDFRYECSDQTVAIVKPVNPNRYFIFVPALVLVALGILFLLFKLLSTREYTFRFYDADTAEPITSTIIEVSVLLPNESPVSHLCGSDGSFTLKTDKANIRFSVKSPYYQTDTIFRTLDKFNRNETVKLRPDNYALMIHYFSSMNVKDWQKRRDQLNRMIADSALIFQVFSKEVPGVELYGKWEFINKLTLPSTGLKNIEILDTRYQEDRITMIRFRQKEARR